MDVEDLEESIRLRVVQLAEESPLAEFRSQSAKCTEESKISIRALHMEQRREQIRRSERWLKARGEALLDHFANGRDVQPCQIRLKVLPVKSGTIEAELFRLCTLTWSVPVSNGYGRRMRFLVVDERTEKVFGVMALGDPVFNLGVRDRAIGWSAEQRKRALTNVMDAFVLGALPPYSHLLGGKLVACLVRTKEIRDTFRSRYGNSKGIISGSNKDPNLLVVTTTSALGRSSVYNRLRLQGTPYFERIGSTRGYGHFHIGADLFSDMKRMLELRGHKYARSYKFGGGPNWRFRTIRAALELIGLDRALLLHGVQREVFLCRLAFNAFSVLRSLSPGCARYADLLDVDHVTQLGLERWVIPRSHSRPEFRFWDRTDLLQSLYRVRAH